MSFEFEFEFVVPSRKRRGPGVVHRGRSRRSIESVDPAEAPVVLSFMAKANQIIHSLDGATSIPFVLRQDPVGFLLEIDDFDHIRKPHSIRVIREDVLLSENEALASPAYESALGDCNRFLDKLVDVDGVLYLRVPTPRLVVSRVDQITHMRIWLNEHEILDPAIAVDIDAIPYVEAGEASLFGTGIQKGWTDLVVNVETIRTAETDASLLSISRRLVQSWTMAPFLSPEAMRVFLDLRDAVRDTPPSPARIASCLFELRGSDYGSRSITDAISLAAYARTSIAGHLCEPINRMADEDMEAFLVHRA